MVDLLLQGICRRFWSPEAPGEEAGRRRPPSRERAAGARYIMILIIDLSVYTQVTHISNVFCGPRPLDSPSFVIPAKAGIQGLQDRVGCPWTPAFAGVTGKEVPASIACAGVKYVKFLTAAIKPGQAVPSMIWQIFLTGNLNGQSRHTHEIQLEARHQERHASCHLQA